MAQPSFVNKPLIAAAIALLAAVGAGAWWATRDMRQAGPSSPTLTAQAEGPFAVGSCMARLYDDQPALAVMFSEPVEADQALDALLQVSDTGSADAENKSAQSAPAEQAVKGGWVLDDNPRVLVFPHVKPQRNFRIRIAAGLKAASGSTLAEAHDCAVASETMAPSYFFASKGTVLPAGQNGGLPIVTVNVPEVDIQFLRVAPEKLPAFIETVVGQRRSSADDEEESDDGYYWDSRENRLKGQTSGWQLDRLKNMAQSVHLGRFLTDEVPNRRKVVFIPVETIPELREPGIYVAVMSLPGRFGQDYQVTYFYVSDIGLHVRHQLKQTDVFATSLKTGSALSGIDLEVLDANGKILSRGKLDGDGRATLDAIPAAARLLLARRGKEVSMLALQEPGLDLSEFDIGGHLPRDAKLFAYAGRDLYRPGERFTVSLLARNADGSALPPMPIKAELKKPDGDVVSATVWQADAATPGYRQHSFDLPADAATGRWTLELRADPAAKRPDTVWSFQVEEFLPERMKLDLSSEEKPLLGDASFSIAVQGDYLFGAPASGNRLLGSVAQSRARNPLAAQWPGFIFGDFADDARNTRGEIEETTLSDDGSAVVDVPFQVSDARSPIRVRASLSLLESGGRPVVRSLERIWWPAPALIAVRPAFERDVAREGSMAEFELIRVATDGKFAPSDEAGFKLIREDRQYYWRFDDRRGWSSGYTEAEELQQSGKLAINARTKLTLPVKWGTYRLEVNDPETGQTLRYRFYAGWNAQDAESVGNRPDRVKIELAGVPAKAGEDVVVTLTPPHDGEALVLVEADKVLWSRRVKVSTEGTRVSIPVDKSWNRADMYISAVVFRPGSEGDRVTPARAVGLAWLPLAREDRRLKVSLNAPARIEPERKTTVRVKVEGAANQPARVTLSAVDVGILNITRFKTPDPFDFFFGKHRYSAEMADLYGKLIEKMDGIAGKLKWGGDAGKRDTQSMPKKVQLVDLFSGPVLLNAQGEANVVLDVPDFNGTLRLMAVAATAERYGHADREMTVAAPIVAEIAMPRFIGTGDKATLALDVTNLSGSAQTLSVKLSAGTPLRISDGERSLKLADKQRQTLRFTAEPTEPYGVARISLQLRTTGDKPIVINREFALQVQPPIPREQDSRRVRLEPGERHRIDPGMAERYFRGSSTLSVSMSNTPPLNVRSIVQGLLDYPYGCLEQTTSAAYPHVFIDEAGARAVGLKPRTLEERARFIEGAIARIAGMQGAQGGFRLWGGDNGDYETWLTPYVSGFLMDARDAGFNVPDDMRKRAQDWMLQKLNNAGNQLPSLPASVQAALRGDASSPASQAERTSSRDYELLRNAHQRFAELAHVGYMLSREQKAQLASLRLLHDQHRQLARSPLPLVHLAIALELMGDSKRAEQALNDAMQRPYGIRSDWEWDWLGDYGTATRDQALAYALLVRHNVKHAQRENLLFKVAEQLGGKRYYSTQERIALFLAARGAGGDSASEWTAALTTPQGETAITASKSETRALDPAQLLRGVSIENRSKSALWLEIDASGFPLKTPAASTDKIVLERAWFTSDGKTWGGGPLNVGDMLIARITAKAKQRIKDGLIVDHIPAGLEVENLNLSQGAQANDFRIGNTNVGEAMQNERIRHREYRDDRFVAAVELDGNPIQLFYLLRVVTPGRYNVPAPYAEDMYRPDIRAFGATPEPISVVDPKQK